MRVAIEAHNSKITVVRTLKKNNFFIFILRFVLFGSISFSRLGLYIYIEYV